MNPLEALLQPITRVLNRNIRESTRASELCARLDGKRIAIRVRDTALSAYFEIGSDALYMTTNHEGEPDVVITGPVRTCLAPPYRARWRNWFCALLSMVCCVSCKS